MTRPTPRRATPEAPRSRSRAAVSGRPASRRTTPAPPRTARTLRLGSPARRLRAALLALGVLLSLFAGRLVQVQGFEATAYADVAQRTRLRTVELSASRGDITDARGAALARSVEARDVTVDQTLVVDAPATARALAPLLGEPALELERRLRGERRFVYLARQVSAETWTKVRALKLPGILSERSSRRVYPAHDLAANVVGFVGSDGAGLSGVERALDGVLAGKDGEATYEVAGGGRRIPLGTQAQTEPVRGHDVQLTIDRDVQWAAQQALARQVEASDAESGTAVVLDVRTGDVVALASAPTFDANDPGAAKSADRGNRALSEVYEPGSTSKLLTAAAVIEDGLVLPDTPITVPPVLERFNEPFRDSTPHGTLQLTFTGVIAKSSNIGTVLAAERMPRERLRSYLEGFGIGAPTGVGLPESPGILAPVKDWSGTTAVTLPYGQGFSVNALQMASAVAALGNDGTYVAPRVVKSWQQEDGTVTPAPASATRQVVRPETARQVREMMEAVVGKGGTAPEAAVPGYRVGGKTGTANRYDPRAGAYRGYTASFIGVAPADEPRLCVAITLQDPKRGMSGGRLAAPVFREVMSFALSSLRIPPTGSAAPAARLEFGPEIEGDTGAGREPTAAAPPSTAGRRPGER